MRISASLYKDLGIAACYTIKEKVVQISKTSDKDRNFILNIAGQTEFALETEVFNWEPQLEKMADNNRKMKIQAIVWPLRRQELQLWS